MSLVTGLFTFRMKAQGIEHPLIAEIKEPGIKAEHVVRIIRGGWGNLVAPGVSQNRIECLGWSAASEIPAGWQRTKPMSAEPVVLWRPAT
jgi:hypothetical protein